MVGMEACRGAHHLGQRLATFSHSVRLITRWLQGEGITRGKLIAGCLEVIDWLRGSVVWPDITAWRDSILVLELSEESIPSSAVVRMFRSLAATTALDVVHGILFGRPYGHPKDFDAYDGALLASRCESGLGTIPLIARMDVGHTDPMMTIPYEIEAEIDCEHRQLRFMTAGVG